MTRRRDHAGQPRPQPKSKTGRWLLERTGETCPETGNDLLRPVWVERGEDLTDRQWARLERWPPPPVEDDTIPF